MIFIDWIPKFRDVGLFYWLIMDRSLFTGVVEQQEAVETWPTCHAKSTVELSCFYGIMDLIAVIILCWVANYMSSSCSVRYMELVSILIRCVLSFGLRYSVHSFCSFYLLSCDLPFPSVLVLLCSSLSLSYVQFISSFVCLSTCLNVVFSVWLRRELRFFQRGSHVILAIGVAHRTRSHSWLLDTASRRLARARPTDCSSARVSWYRAAQSIVCSMIDCCASVVCTSFFIHPLSIGWYTVLYH